MSMPELRRRVGRRLEELYRRQLGADLGDGVRYYESGRGYVGRESAGAEAERFGIALATLDGEIHEAGDHGLPFALQSISKVFAYAVALEDNGRDRVLRHVGVEPSGDAFHSISFDERNDRPHNPMVNAGAL